MDLERPVNSDPRRSLPAVDRLIRQALAARPDLPRWAVRLAAREALERLRSRVAETGSPSPLGRRAAGDRSAADDASASPNGEAEASLLAWVVEGAQQWAAPVPRGVVNATGIVLHTNLGRAPLAATARDAVAAAASGYCDLELDLETGRRGARLGRLAAKLVELTGAEAAHVVNNNAAAVLLALNTLAMGRPVVVSRGELVEIGGSFRIPEVMARAGVQLHEVGTTNRTHLADYEAALAVSPALLLKVHRSNFEQRGFVAEPDVRALAALAHAHGLPLLEDLGSGTLVDLSAHGLPPEAYAPARLALGVDLVCLSGDKLMGGPQAGILLGRRDLIEAMRRNPLARALRVDKLVIAALDATLDLLLEPARAERVPVVAALTAGEGVLRERAGRLAKALEAVVPPPYACTLEPSEGAVGGGSLPELALPGVAVVMRGPSLQRLVERLRRAPVPVVARIADDALRLDVRTVVDAEIAVIVEAFTLAFR
ncbi:MAG: L-seryl-tRNA(Sec) selenium transferase [Myxococcota bacterium]